MFGWEFPPLNSGGLGTACQGLTKALVSKGIDISFVLPKSQEDIKIDYMKLIIANNLKDSTLNNGLKFHYVNSLLSPYMNSIIYSNELKEFRDLFGLDESKLIYGPDLFKEVARYTKEAEKIAAQENFDIIHCHDWMTIGAGVKAKNISKLKGKLKPLVLHIHATEFDRTGGNPNDIIYEIEKFGMENADQIITVSEYTKNIISYKYGIPKERIAVVYNGIDPSDFRLNEAYNLKKHYKLVLYLGRMTLQKGPDYFLKAAKYVCDKSKDIKFIFSGNGDMFPRMVEEAASLGIADKIFFTNFVRGYDVDRAYEMSDLYVLPSVSEPFGITALEALSKKVPVILSKQSGVSEVINNCYKVDFWDIHKMANSIIEILDNPEIHSNLKEQGYNEVKNITWDNAASTCINIYSKWRSD